MKRKSLAIGLVLALLLTCALAAWTPGGRARMRPTVGAASGQAEDAREKVGEAAVASTSTPVYDADCVGLSMYECADVRATVYALTPQTPYVTRIVSDQLVTVLPGYPAPWDVTPEPGYPAPGGER